MGGWIGERGGWEGREGRMGGWIREGREGRMGGWIREGRGEDGRMDKGGERRGWEDG